MSKSLIVAHILNADGNLTKFLPAAKLAVARVEKKIHTELCINWIIDLMITSGIKEISGPEGIGGTVMDKQWVIINIAPDCPSRKDMVSLLHQIMCHEFAHVARETTSPRLKSKTLLDEVVHEGIAIAYEEHIATKEEPPREFTKKIISTSEKDVVRLIKKLPPLNTKCTEYDSSLLFGDGSDYDYEYGQWPGYVIGYYLVKQYLKKTNRTITKAIYDSNKKYHEVLDKILTKKMRASQKHA